MTQSADHDLGVVQVEVVVMRRDEDPLIVQPGRDHQVQRHAHDSRAETNAAGDRRQQRASRSCPLPVAPERKPDQLQSIWQRCRGSVPLRSLNQMPVTPDGKHSAISLPTFVQCMMLASRPNVVCCVVVMSLKVGVKRTWPTRAQTSLMTHIRHWRRNIGYLTENSAPQQLVL